MRCYFYVIYFNRQPTYLLQNEHLVKSLNPLRLDWMIIASEIQKFKILKTPIKIIENFLFMVSRGNLLNLSIVPKFTK